MARKPSPETEIANRIIARFLLRSRPNLRSLPDNYWRDSRFKKFYSREIKFVKSLFKKYDPEIVYATVLKYEKINTAADFSTIHYYIGLTLEQVERVNSPKDTSPAKPAQKTQFTDLLTRKTKHSKLSPRQFLKEKYGEKERGE